MNTTDTASPLAGVTVVVTRPVEQADTLAELVAARGARPLVVPLIELVDVATADEVATALAPLTDGCWVVVASAHAASRVRGVLATCPARVAAVGATTARALPRADLVAERQSAEGLVAVFPAATGGDARVVVVQAADGAPTLVDGIRALGWHTTRLDTHRSRPLTPSTAQQFAVLQADAVVFTSGTQAESWVNVFGDATPPVIVTIGPQTTRRTEAVGLKVTCTAADHSLPGVLDALERCFPR
ncbi:MAG: uroporphyrinogen-III synthase [Acidimicrobiales bacterium]|nr:uroporphyrinogen-III synthase [Acidimicrobiales bacterium]MCB9392631.1 uroporphyrinogen-III synthase [Acidimicrobiaceae bacterium]